MANFRFPYTVADNDMISFPMQTNRFSGWDIDGETATFNITEKRESVSGVLIDTIDLLLGMLRFNLC